MALLQRFRQLCNPRLIWYNDELAWQGKKVAINARLCEGAFDALMSGDAAKHDALVSDALSQLMKEVDVILLAQASMARVVDTLPNEKMQVPVLASPPKCYSIYSKLSLMVQ